MKSVLISIQPKWVEKIASGEKTIEVRKTKPNLETPFKCYIYCTNGTQLVDVRKERIYLDINKRFLLTNGKSNNVISSTPPQVNRKVIGEFVCDRIDISVVELKPNDIEPCYWKLINGSCLTKNELMNYGKYNALYGWHISDLKIYDKPKELSEFTKYMDCKNTYDCCACHNWSRLNLKCIAMNNEVKRPPQSWCYVEVE